MRVPTKAGPIHSREALLSGTRPTTYWIEKRARATPRPSKRAPLVAVETVLASSIPITATLDPQVTITIGDLLCHPLMPPQPINPELNQDLAKAKTRRVARARKLPGSSNQLLKLGRRSL